MNVRYSLTFLAQGMATPIYSKVNMIRHFSLSKIVLIVSVSTGNNINTATAIVLEDLAQKFI